MSSPLVEGSVTIRRCDAAAWMAWLAAVGMLAWDSADGHPGLLAWWAVPVCAAAAVLTMIAWLQSRLTGPIEAYRLGAEGRRLAVLRDMPRVRASEPDLDRVP